MSKTAEEYFKEVQQTIQDHRLHYTMESDEDSGLSVLDRLTPDGDGNVSRGIEEVELLTEAIFEVVEEYAQQRVSELEKENGKLKEVIEFADEELSRLKTGKESQLLENFKELEEENERLKNDLLDALDLKEGKGPTALSMLSNRVKELERSNKELVEENNKLKAELRPVEFLSQLKNQTQTK